MIECNIPGCEKPIASKGYCWGHYKRFIKHGSPFYRRKPKFVKCSKKGCENKSRSVGLCQRHYCQMMYNKWKEIGSRVCAIDGCDKVTRTSNTKYCDHHHQRIYKYGNPFHECRERLPSQARIDSGGICKEIGCSLKWYAKNLCKKHYLAMQYRVRKLRKS